MRRDSQRLSDIVAAGSQIALYIESRTAMDFITDQYFQDAVLHQLTIVGEAASKLSTGFRFNHSAVPWTRIIGFRQRIVHDYFGFNLDTAWRIAKVAVPELTVQVAEILATEFVDDSDW